MQSNPSSVLNRPENRVQSTHGKASEISPEAVVVPVCESVPALGDKGHAGASEPFFGVCLFFFVGLGIWFLTGSYLGPFGGRLESVVAGIPAGAQDAERLRSTPFVTPAFGTAFSSQHVLAASKPFLRVLRAEDLQPLVGAAVVASLSDGTPWLGTTDAKGVCILPAQRGHGWIGAGLQGRVSAALAPGAGRRGGEMRRLLLDPSTVLSGQIHGANQRMGPLALTSFADPLANAPPWIAEALKRAGVSGRIPYTIQPEDDGTFRLEGLPGNWSGRLRAPRHHWFHTSCSNSSLSRRDALDLSVVAQALDLQVCALPVLRGRLLGAVTGQPMDKASICVIPFFQGEESRPAFRAWTDAEGRFELAYGPVSACSSADSGLGRSAPTLERLECVFECEGFVTRRFVIPASEIPLGGDLGELKCSDTPLLQARATDTHLVPLNGAIALLGRNQSRPAHSDGVVGIAADDLQSEALVLAAVGHRRALYSAQVGGGEEIQSVELVPGGEVILRMPQVWFGSSSSRQRYSVELVSTGLPMLGADQGHGSPMPLAIPSQSGFQLDSPLEALATGDAHQSTQVWRMNLRLDRTGEIRMFGFLPGVPLEFVIRDRTGSVIARAEETTPQDSSPLVIVLP